MVRLMVEGQILIENPGAFDWCHGVQCHDGNRRRSSNRRDREERVYWCGGWDGEDNQFPFDLLRCKPHWRISPSPIDNGQCVIVETVGPNREKILCEHLLGVPDQHRRIYNDRAAVGVGNVLEVRTSVSSGFEPNPPRFGGQIGRTFRIAATATRSPLHGVVRKDVQPSHEIGYGNGWGGELRRVGPGKGGRKRRKLLFLSSGK